MLKGTIRLRKRRRVICIHYIEEALWKKKHWPTVEIVTCGFKRTGERVVVAVIVSDVALLKIKDLDKETITTV